MRKAVSRVYKLGGQLFYQQGYKRSGKLVKGHLKTYPDTKANNNRKAILGY